MPDEKRPVLVRDPDGTERPASVTEMLASCRWNKAIDRYLRFGDVAPVEALLKEDYIPPYGRRFLAALVRGDLKRRRGRPPKHRYTPEQVVQLVERAKIEGYGFSGTHGNDGNEAFCFVAANLSVSSGQIAKIYYGVPDLQRQRIGAWLRHLIQKNKS
ncbi:MAG: hypothetical protein L0H73_11625 [Nitrococcus sp.]|nr:hypothetical protein [Nitrococcus sp.]